MKKIILASGSPRRKELLEQIGLKFEVVISEYEEDMTMKLEPRELAKKISLEKAKDIVKRVGDAIIIAADTFVVQSGELLGKPHTDEKATEMLHKISGKTHQVITGFTIIDTNTGKKISDATVTDVKMREMSEEEISGYVKSGETLDKAGAYAIQGLGGIFIEGIEGSYYNVMGLPICDLTERLKEFGVKVIG